MGPCFQFSIILGVTSQGVAFEGSNHLIQASCNAHCAGLFVRGLELLKGPKPAASWSQERHAFRVGRHGRDYELLQSWEPLNAVSEWACFVSSGSAQEMTAKGKSQRSEE